MQKKAKEINERNRKEKRKRNELESPNFRTPQQLEEDIEFSKAFDTLPNFNEFEDFYSGDPTFG